MVSRSASPEAYTPKHLAERIPTANAALEGKRKHVTVLFADLKGSMELIADRDPEEARKILDPVLAHMSTRRSRTKTTPSAPAMARSGCRNRSIATPRRRGARTA
jgi:class 3 adenylate cyclase